MHRRFAPVHIRGELKMREQSAAEKAVAEKSAAQKKLIAMRKDETTINVCKAQVGQHQRLGWQLVEK
jgi:hypothetical protein